MTCDEIKNMLPAYLEGDLSQEEMDKIAGHLHTCISCEQALTDLKTTADVLKNLPEIEPPPFFEQRIMAHIREEAASKKGFWRKFFYPFHIKIPIQAMATIMIAVLAFYVYRGGDPEIKQIAPIPIPAPVTELQKDVEKAQPQKTRQAEDTSAQTQRIQKNTNSDLKEKSSFVTLPPEKGRIADQPVAAHAPVREEGSLSLNEAAPGEVAPKEIAKDKLKPMADGLGLNKEQASPPSREIEKVYDVSARKSEKKDIMAETAAPMKQARSKSIMPAFSSALSGASQKISITDLTIHVRNIDAAYAEIEKRVNKINARIVERQQTGGNEILKIEIETHQFPNLLAGLNDIGPVEQRQKSSAFPDGKTIVSIEIIPLP